MTRCRFRRSGAWALALVVLAVPAVGCGSSGSRAAQSTATTSLDVGVLSSYDSAPDPALVDTLIARLDALGLDHVDKADLTYAFKGGSFICRGLQASLRMIVNSFENDASTTVPFRLADVATYCPDAYDALEAALKADPRYSSLPYQHYRDVLRSASSASGSASSGG